MPQSPEPLPRTPFETISERLPDLPAPLAPTIHRAVIDTNVLLSCVD